VPAMVATAMRDNRSGRMSDSITVDAPHGTHPLKSANHLCSVGPAKNSTKPNARVSWVQ
jgi:hypothetical protein